MTEFLADRLSMKHLTEEVGLADLADDLDKKTEQLTRPILKPAEEVEAKQNEDKRTERTYTFAFSWKDGRGKVWEGSFTNEILSIQMKGKVSVLVSALCNGLPWQSFSPLAQQLFTARSHMHYSLKKKAKWADDLETISDEELILTLYEEVASHEAVFHGRPTPQELREA